MAVFYINVYLESRCLHILFWTSFCFPSPPTCPKHMLLQRQLRRLNVSQIYHISSIGSLLSVIFRDFSDKICLSVSSLYIYISGHGSGWRGDASNLTRKLRAFSVKYVKISKDHQWWGVANDQCYQCTTTVQWSIEGRYFPLNVAFFPF